MQNPTLLILAAGMGSRYGGLKQIDPVGPNGETVIDYSVYDAFRAGFRQLVFVIRRDIKDMFTEFAGGRFNEQISVRYVFQELDRLPPGFTLSPSRRKPWGTAQAILVAGEVVQGSFAVINADDFYGRESFYVLAEHLRRAGSDYATVGFSLGSTLSDFGGVSRGVCLEWEDGYLRSIVEYTDIVKRLTGAKHADSAGADKHFSGNETVSMTMWGFTSTIFGHLQQQFTDFLKRSAHDDEAEFYIPDAVNELVESRQERCKVLKTSGAWLGVTYREDQRRVARGIRRLIESRHYPEKLWE